MPDSASKRCTTCGEVKPLSEFRRDTKARDGFSWACTPCRAEADHRYYIAHRDALLERRRQYHADNREVVHRSQRRYLQANRDAVFSHYGRACACCGETRNLTIDHVNGDGAEHRRKLYGDPNQGSSRFYIWLIKQGFPAGVQTLCDRCNKSKSNGERCRINHDLEQDVENDAW